MAFDEFLQAYRKPSQISLSDNEHTLFLSVGHSLLRLDRFLSLTLSLLFSHCGHALTRSRATRYRVIIALITDRAIAIKRSALKQILAIEPPNEVHALLVCFLFSPSLTAPAIEGVDEGALLTAWSKVFDHNYLIADFIPYLSSVHSSLSSLLSSLSSRLASRAHRVGQQARRLSGISNGEKMIFSHTQTTKPEPFQLSEPRPRALLEPVEIVSEFRALPVAAAVVDPHTQARIKEADKTRAETVRKQTMAKHEKARPPVLLTSTRVSDYHPTLPALEAAKEKASEQKAKPFVAKPAPQTTSSSSSSSSLESKATAAQILRDSHFQRARLAAESAALSASLAALAIGGLATAEEIGQRVLEGHQQEEERRLRLTEERRADADVAAERMRADAAEKRARARDSVRQARREELERKQERKQQFVETIEDKQIIAREVRESEERVADRVAAVRDRRAEAARAVKEQAMADRRAIEEEAARQLEEKRALIASIKALEVTLDYEQRVLLAAQRRPGDAAAAESLDSMGLQELRSRLKEMKGREEEAIQRKREKLAIEKAEKAAVLDEMSRRIEGHRRKMAKEKDKTRENKREEKQSEERERAQADERAMATLALRLADQRGARTAAALALAEERRRARTHVAMIEAAKRGSRESKQEDKKKTMERLEATDAAEAARLDELAALRGAKLAADRRRNERHVKKTQAAIRAAVDAQLRQHRSEAAEVDNFDQRLKADQAQRMRERERLVDLATQQRKPA